jgi:hypothetical protein
VFKPVASDAMAIRDLPPGALRKIVGEPPHRKKSCPQPALLQQCEKALELALDLGWIRSLVTVSMIAQLLTAVVFEVDRE